MTYISHNASAVHKKLWNAFSTIYPKRVRINPMLLFWNRLTERSGSLYNQVQYSLL
jgi:hypothetical protein